MASPTAFRIYDEEAKALLGDSPQLELLHKNQEYPFAHEAGVFIDGNLFITSSGFSDPSTGNKKIQISKVTLPSNAQASGAGQPAAHVEEIEAPGIPMANGGVNYRDGVLFCAQGTLNQTGGLVYMDSEPPYRCETIIDSFHGRPFNSVNDVVVHSDDSIWFTDPTYGHEQGFRPKPKLPSQVYRYDPSRKSIRAIADGFGHPNGICFSPDEKTVYVTDTDWMNGSGTSDDTRPSHIYAFDVTHYAKEPFLTNRRLFAMADVGIPDGIKCDVHGNVYSGCGDGVSIWSAGGVLLAKILVEGGAANFCFGKEGEIFILNEHRLWRARLASSTKGALLGI